MNGYRENGTESGGSTYMPPANFNESSLPLMVDWRAKGAVTPVKSQGPNVRPAGAFSTTGSLEGQNFLKTGYLVSLSEQNLVDCSGPFGNGGCRGGKMTNAFKYIQANGGIDTEQSYPYMGMDQYCSFRREYVGATCTGHKVIARGSEDFLKMAVATVGPISAVIVASHPSFQFYHGEVYYEPMCSSQILDHAVLVVGYGVQAGRKYWLVKNSYGPSWGLNGYFLMSRDLNNHCGIATDASFPLV
ncbi:procathepsin L-like [Amblyomma americanum]